MLSSSKSTLRSKLVIVTAILCFAFALRLLPVSSFPVWTDEGWTIWAVSSHDFTQITNTLANDRHPPAYFLALSAWSSLAGDSHLGLRFLSVAFGLINVALVYRLALDWFGQWAAVYAALLFSVLSVPIYFAQEVRNYGLLAFSVTLMTFFLLRYLRHPRWKWLALYVVAVTLMLYTQFIGLAVLGLQGLFALFLWRGSLRHKAYLIGAWIIILILYLPWLPVTVTQVMANFHAGGFNDSVGHTAYTLPDFLRVLDTLFDGQLALLGGVSLLGLAAIRRTEQWYVALGGLGLYSAFFLLSLRVDVLKPRTLVMFVPMLVLLCGYGFQQIGSSSLRRLLFCLTLIVVLVRVDVVQPRIDADRIAQTIGEHVDSQDLIVLEMGWDSFAIQYELEQAGVRAPTFMPWLPRAANSPDVDVARINDLRPLLDQYPRVLVLNWTQPAYAIPLFEHDLPAYHQIESFDIDVGQQLSTLFEDRTIQAALFERLDSAVAQHNFGQLFTLHDAIAPLTAQAGDRIFVDLWWSAAATPDLDYSVGVYLMDQSQQVFAQDDGQPGDFPTSAWKAGSLYFDRHSLVIPASLPVGTYDLVVGVYWFGDPTPLPVEGAPFVKIGSLVVTSAAP